jgi:hypothetical protein
MPEKNKHLARFGFSFQRGGAHTARTMMLEELGALLTYVDLGSVVNSGHQTSYATFDGLAKTHYAYFVFLRVHQLLAL